MTLKFLTSFDAARSRANIQTHFQETAGWTNSAISFVNQFNWLSVDGYLGGRALAGAGSVAESVNLRSADLLDDDANFLSFWIKCKFDPPLEGGNVNADCVMGFGRGSILSMGLRFESITGEGGANVLWFYSTDAGGAIATSPLDDPFVLEEDTWYNFEIYVKTSTTRQVEVRASGITVLLATGSDATAIMGAQSFPPTRFGGWLSTPGSIYSQGNYCAVDHLVAWDNDSTSPNEFPTSWIGPRIVEETNPGQDRQADFTPVPSGGSNYENVDDGETGQYNDTTYNETLVDAALDLYQHRKTQRIMGQIDALTIEHRFNNDTLVQKMVVANEVDAAQITQFSAQNQWVNEQYRIFEDPLPGATRKFDVDKLRLYYWGVGDFNEYNQEDIVDPPTTELNLNYGTLSAPTGTALDKGTHTAPSGEGADLGGF